MVRLIEEKSTFKKLWERKQFEIVKTYNHPTDLFVDIKDSKLISFLNCENSNKDLMQIGVEVKYQRITEKGKVQNDTFHVLTKIIERKALLSGLEMFRIWKKKLENHQQQGSGWVRNGIGNMHVNYFVKTRSIKTYSKSVKWPIGVSGMHHVANIQTEEVCVHLSMVTHFC